MKTKWKRTGGILLAVLVVLGVLGAPGLGLLVAMDWALSG